MSSCVVYGNFTSTLREGNTLSAEAAAFYAALNILLSITAFLGNTLILIALRKVSSVHPPTKLLFRCLAVTDLCVGLIAQPIYATLMMNAVTTIKLNIFCNILLVNFALTFILCGLSIFTSTAISVDRLLALLLGLRYRQVVTIRRVRAVTLCFWLTITSVTGFMHFLGGPRFSYTAGIVFTMVCLFISVLSYTKIFLALRKQQVYAQVQIYQGQPNDEGIPLIIARYKKTVFSIAWVQLALVACYSPYIISAITIRMNANKDGWGGMGARIIWEASLTLVFLNSTLNPILYCWKITEVRKAVKDTLRQFCCSR